MPKPYKAHTAITGPLARRQTLRDLAQVLPLFVVLFFLFGGAVVLAVLQSFGYAPWFGINEFPSTHYYERLWLSADFWLSLGYTLYYAIAATLIGLVISIPLSIALCARFKASRIFSALIRLPLMVPYSVGIALALVMLGNGGLLSRFSAFIGWIDDPAQFPLILRTHWGWGIIAVYVWKQVPFMTLALAAVLVRKGDDTHEAALVLGATSSQIFWRVTLPQIMPGIVSASLICFAFNIGAFEAPFILGGGYPDTLPVLAWRYFQDANYAFQLQGMAVVVSLALVSGLILSLYLLAYRRYERARGRV
ncbi:Putrescine transport system permease protein PotH [Pseudovibrio axinellae]|uniref:Putrescine transport system permease protein PotH n=1 Tax=Pseudovibrio axinellae TaxID=989403 RepID=A0A161V8B9_9HYPH|nr:ABC transporter permease subunit [Pseudovibrio axinellae]KZL15428.1 Putrescine transport system permease protein PotH [Pseudovibrio axinellae]SER56046.1 putative spermidine/putrescine transport system permease protein [Pseudovibrio axinellae]